jgi:nucleotidyltransferase substrate binding protein (TIGR01987 family)
MECTKGFFEYQGKTSIMGSRDATREAFSRNLLTDGETWMDMITSRNLSSHTYDEKIANVIVERIIVLYYPLFIELQDRMQELYDVD